MSKLFASVSSDAIPQPATRGGNRFMNVWVQTERGRIEVEMVASGTFLVTFVPILDRTPVEAAREVIVKGNATQGEWERLS